MTPDSNKVTEVFDDWAERGRAEGMERGHNHAARAGFDLLALAAGNRYLDIGCGNGYSVRWAATAASSVRAVGIDIAPKMIERARSQSSSLDNCEFLCGAFPNNALKDSSFNCIFSMEVLYYVPDLEGAIASVARLLAPGGRFVSIIDHYAENVASHSWGPDMGLELHLKSAPQWRELFAAAGFADVEQSRVRAPAIAGEPESWKQTQGSLMTFGKIAGN